jgi:hypothetical protein
MGAGAMSATTSFSTAHGAASTAAIAALPPIAYPIAPNARQIVGIEEGENIGGHGGVGMVGRCERVPVVVEVKHVHGAREVVR